MSVEVSKARCTTKFIVSGSVEGFSESTSTQQKLDVLHSTLFAQVKADSKHSRSDAEGWYQEYVATLKSVGWQLEMFEFQQYTPRGIFFSFSTVVEKEMATLQSLNMENHKARLFYEQSLEKNTSNFQIIQLKEDSDSGVTMKFAAYYAHMSKRWMDRIHSLNCSYLNVSMPTLLVKLFCGTQEGHISSDSYAIHRERVLKELTENQALPQLIPVPE